MRRIAVVSVALLAGSWPVVAIAQEIAEGERIVTIHKAELRSGNDTTGTVPEGNVLDVKHVNGDWFGSRGPCTKRSKVGSAARM